MEVIKTISGMRRKRQALDETVGFVPTMGYLHEGHLSLVKRARNENANVVVSIFVNPTQFGPSEDLKSYPRDTERDLTILEPYTDIVFMPEADEMYQDKFDTWVEVGSITDKLEGASRPTHFKGVTTIVTKLFNIVQPTKAYFGQKDAQQLLVIKKMVLELNINLEIVTCPTEREPDGLAMSSRNTYLSPEQRKASTVLSKSLELAKELWSQGERNGDKIRKRLAEFIRTEPLADIDYVSVADTETLEEIDIIMNTALVSMAVKFGKTRLIDNIILENSN
jgi:pantoate--beta-alanine ligase